MKKLLTAIALAMAACVSEREIEAPTVFPADGMADVEVQASMPASATVSTTRQVAVPTENTVTDAYVLVFKTTGELVYKGLGRGIAQSGDYYETVTFRATLPIGEAYDFMVLTNASQLLNNVSVGKTPAMTKTDVKALVQEFTSVNSTDNNRWKWMFPIPMWDEKRLTLQAEDTASFNLMRMLARINIEYKPAAGTANYFRLTSARYYNYNTRGMLVPDDANLTGTGAERKATAPTLPANAGTQEEQSVLYTGQDVTNFNRIFYRIYAFEAATRGKYTDGDDKWVHNPCLVIGGRYDANKDGIYDETETETWYRVDFIKKDTDDYLSILRNFTYNVTITSVSGPGYKDPDIALKSAPVGIESSVINWNDGEMDQVIFDGTSYLSVNKHELVLGRHATTERLADGSNSLDIKTDYTVNGFPDRSGWKAEYYTDAAGTIPMANPWLKIINGSLTDKGPVTGSPDDPAAHTFFEFEENDGDKNRTAYVFITAGRMRYRVKVTQKLLSMDLFETTGGGEVRKDSMLFIIPHNNWGPNPNRNHTPRTFRVKWYPADYPVDVTNNSPLAFNPFKPAWVKDLSNNSFPLPGPGGSYNFTDISGVRNYEVDPPTVSDADLDLDPFYDKESVYKFEVDNDGESDSATIRLRQVFYNIVVDTHKYRLDGATHTLTVRSNTEWKITKIEQWLYNNDPATTTPAPTTPIMLNLNQYDNLREGTTGGYNVNGEALAFTVVNAESGTHKDKWGTVRVTFESPEKKFPPKTVALTFPPATRLILGLGHALDVRSTNVAFGTPYHLNSAFQMLASPYNFGSMDESVVKVEGLRIKGYNATGLPAGAPPAANPDFEWHNQSLVNWLNNDSPDIIISSSFQTLPVIYSDRECNLLKQYLENGGALIMMYNAGAGGQADVARFMKWIFGGNYSVTTNENAGTYDVINWNAAPATGAVYQFNNIDDPILNGPFGRLQGLHWGSHYYRSSIKSSLIENDAVVLSNANELSTGSGNANHAIIWRHKRYNLLFIGQDAFTSSYYDYYMTQERNHDPFKLDKDRYYYPIGRPEFNNAVNPYTVYNSVLLGNAVAWALSVTNHMPPSGGYVNP